jgi:Na+-transporting NADH:ubiquinone oxidoreductase subunit A
MNEMHIAIRNGLKTPHSVTAKLSIKPGPQISSVALHGGDYAFLRARVQVNEGDRVEAGEVLFSDRRNSLIRFISPASGIVREIREGPGKSLQSIVVATEGPLPESVHAGVVTGHPQSIARMPLEGLQDRLLATGLWTALRVRPGDGVPLPDSIADAVFITAIDTEPLAPNPGEVLGDRLDAFEAGLTAVCRFASRTAWLCIAPGSPLARVALPDNARLAEFAGPHPAGLPGTHIGHLAPLEPGMTAWHIGYQDVAAVGEMLIGGRLPLTRVMAVCSPGRSKPQLQRVQLGANIQELLAGPDVSGSRIFSGSMLSGRAVEPPFEHLGRFHRQVTVLQEDSDEPGNWPWKGRVAGHRFLPSYRLQERVFGMQVNDALDRAWPMAEPVAPLLRALMVGDMDSAVALGCLDLAEEDLALSSLLCPGRHDYGAYLREMLYTVRQEYRS